MDINATIIGQLVAFVFFVIFCMKMVWPPIMAAIEDRQKTIADGLAASERAKVSRRCCSSSSFVKNKLANVLPRVLLGDMGVECSSSAVDCLMGEETTGRIPNVTAVACCCLLLPAGAGLLPAVAGWCWPLPAVAVLLPAVAGCCRLLPGCCRLLAKKLAVAKIQP